MLMLLIVQTLHHQVQIFLDRAIDARICPVHLSPNLSDVRLIVKPVQSIAEQQNTNIDEFSRFRSWHEPEYKILHESHGCVPLFSGQKFSGSVLYRSRVFRIF